VGAAAVVVGAIDVVVAVAVHDRVIEPWLYEPALEYCGDIKPCDLVGLT
jgi:hypothetical protein